VLLFRHHLALLGSFWEEFAMLELKRQQCHACHADAMPLTEQECRLLNKQIPDWSIVTRNNIRLLEREFQFSNFKFAIEFTDKVANLAEQQNHHPAILTEWGKVTVTWWSHKLKGLHQNDFICAIKTDELICAGLKLSGLEL
jgi:4a-hydroxytetrahydrobiopterin dehydratase